MAMPFLAEFWSKICGSRQWEWRPRTPIHVRGPDLNTASGVIVYEQHIIYNATAFILCTASETSGTNDQEPIDMGAVKRCADFDVDDDVQSVGHGRSRKIAYINNNKKLLE